MSWLPAIKNGVWNAWILLLTIFLNLYRDGDCFSLVGIPVASVVLVILPRSQITVEERGCLALFGTAYQEYLNKTPRGLGIPKSR